MNLQEQQSVLLKIFPAFARQPKESRTLQVKVLNDKFDIIDWFDGTNSPKRRKKAYPFQRLNWDGHSWLIIKFINTKFRARLVHKLPPIYVLVMQRGEGTPLVLFYNQMCPKERWEKDPTLKGTYLYEDAWHPHITSSEPCNGAHSMYLARTAQDGSIVGFMSAIRNFLSSWNNRSRFWNLNSYNHYTGKFARKVILPAWDVAYLHHNTGGSYEGRYNPRHDAQNTYYGSTVPKLYLLLMEQSKGAHKKEVCAIITGLNRAMAQVNSRTIADKLVRNTVEWHDWTDLSRWYNNGWSHRRHKVNDSLRRNLRSLYYNYQEILFDLFPHYIGTKSMVPEDVIDEDKLEDFAKFAYDYWMSTGGWGEYCKGSDPDRSRQNLRTAFVDYWSISFDMTYSQVLTKLNPRKMYGDSWGHKRVINVLKAARQQCCYMALADNKSRRKEIINEIRTLETDSTEDRIFQQILQF